MTQPRRVRLLHTSDLHLGAFVSRDDPMPRAEAEARRALWRVVALAAAEAVDVVLIAGDLFDSPRVPDETVAFAIEALAGLTAPAVLLPGNHDHCGKGSAYVRFDFAAETRTTRVILRNAGETIRFPELGLAVWGRAHDGHSPELRPLESVPTRGPERWQVAVAHGHYVPPGETSDRHAPIYAEEIEASGRDYVALGHWDRYAPLRHGAVTACYSGSPTPSPPARRSGTVALVTLDPAAGMAVAPLRVDVEPGARPDRQPHEQEGAWRSSTAATS